MLSRERNWKGVVGKEPSTEAVKAALKKCDLYMYAFSLLFFFF
jgi:hypothetical protein